MYDSFGSKGPELQNLLQHFGSVQSWHKRTNERLRHFFRLILKDDSTELPFRKRRKKYKLRLRILEE